ncbi:hypothetical protein ACH5RR_010515 [Cinchona calisaya]|uniref:WIYLD domain-containing protein n=1 Tax=Cinchona calisaya TaxID=153742 RepID=A0ABD3AJ61_9GENT
MPPNPRVARAFRAMRNLGIAEVKVKPVLKNLLKLFDKNWDLIEEENYRVLADAIFDIEEAEAAQSKKQVKHTEQVIVLDEEAQEQDEPAQKKLCLDYGGQTSVSNDNSAYLAGTSLMRSKDEPVELPEVHPRTQVGSRVGRTPQNNEKRKIESQRASCESLDRNIGNQPVSPKSLTMQEITGTSQSVSADKSQTDTLTPTDSVAVPHPMSPRKRGKEALSPHFACGEKKKLESQLYQGVLKEKTVGVETLIEPEEEPFTSEMPESNLPPPVFCPEASVEGESSAEPLGSKYTSGGVPATMLNESASQLEIASSPLGEVKICLSYNISPARPDFRVPSVDEVLMAVEDRCLGSYKQQDPNFSLKKLMKDVCEAVLELGCETCNEPEERN